MRVHKVLIFCVLLVAVRGIGARYQQPVMAAAASPQSDRPQLPPTYIPSGKQLFNEYCASCHGPDGKGLGPVAPLFRKPPPNLTILSKQNQGHFPEDRVTKILYFGTGFPSHGSMEMPVWGPVFKIVENYNEAAVQMRIKNLCDYLKSIQEK
jgi:mono/diheme cytochrome c family protein